MAKRPKYLYEVGNEYFRKIIYECELCGGSMWNFFDEYDYYMCPNCAFRFGLCTEKEYLEAEYYAYRGMELKAVVIDRKIYVAEKHKKFEFEKQDKDYRQDIRYKNWRKYVFERDNFTCQECGQVGGSLNAHHIKPFKDYKDLRYEVSNGITLCEKCHRELHKRLRKNGRQR